MKKLIGIFSLIYLIGTVGAMELGDITIKQAIIRATIGLTVFYISTKEIKERGENRYARKPKRSTRII